MIDQLYSLAREYTDLTEVQARILTHIEESDLYLRSGKEQRYDCHPGSRKAFV